MIVQSAPELIRIMKAKTATKAMGWIIVIGLVLMFISPFLLAGCMIIGLIKALSTLE